VLPITRPELEVECVLGGRAELEQLTEDVLGPPAPSGEVARDAAWELLEKKFPVPRGVGVEVEGAAEEGEVEGCLAEEDAAEEDTSAATADAEAQHGLDGGEGEGEGRGEPVDAESSVPGAAP